MNNQNHWDRWKKIIEGAIISTRDRIKKSLKSFQRVYKITPSYNSVETLYEDGLYSAYGEIMLPVIEGRMRDSNGRPRVNARIIAVNKTLKGEEILGETKTDNTGNYEIEYGMEDFLPGEKDKGDLIIYIYPSNNSSTDEEKSYSEMLQETLNTEFPTDNIKSRISKNDLQLKTNLKR